MTDSITTLLNDLSTRLDSDVLAKDETERELYEDFSETQHRVTAVSEEIKQLADPDAALTFRGELSTFIETHRAKALETHRLREEIAERQARLIESQDELNYLSAGRASLAEKVNDAMHALEEAKREYADYELRIGVIERNIEATRLERSEIRRQLAELTKVKGDRN